LLALCLTAGCKAQTAPPALNPSDAVQVNRRIEVMVRSQFAVPQDYVISVGVRSPSKISGYDALPITLSHGDKSTTLDFLISADSKTLAHLDKFDLAKDPVFSIDVAGRPIRGNPAAKVTVINFDDLECPYCSMMHQTLFPETLEHYKDMVRFIYLDNPLTEIHPSPAPPVSSARLASFPGTSRLGPSLPTSGGPASRSGTLVTSKVYDWIR